MLEIFWNCISNLSSTATLISGLVDVIDKNELDRLYTLDSGIDYSTLIADLEPHMEIVEKYLTKKRNDIIGQHLFSVSEKEQFILELFRQEPKLQQYSNEVEAVLRTFLEELEQLLIKHMTPGEIAIVHKIDTNRRLLQSILDKDNGKSHQKESQPLTKAKIYTANELYAQSFTEGLFLHKGSDKVNLLNIFVLQKYIEGRHLEAGPQTDLNHRLLNSCNRKSVRAYSSKGTPEVGKAA